MFVLALKDREDEGLYAVEEPDGTKILYLFEEEDDADRFAGLLEADDFPEIIVIEVEDKTTVDICEIHNYTYTIIKKDDLVIPPRYNDLL